MLSQERRTAGHGWAGRAAGGAPPAWPPPRWPSAACCLPAPPALCGTPMGKRFVSGALRTMQPWRSRHAATAVPACSHDDPGMQAPLGSPPGSGAHPWAARTAWREDTSRAPSSRVAATSLVAVRHMPAALPHTPRTPLLRLSTCLSIVCGQPEAGASCVAPWSPAVPPLAVQVVSSRFTSLSRLARRDTLSPHGTLSRQSPIQLPSRPGQAGFPGLPGRPERACGPPQSRHCCAACACWLQQHWGAGARGCCRPPPAHHISRMTGIVNCSTSCHAWQKVIERLGGSSADCRGRQQLQGQRPARCLRKAGC